MRKIRILCGAVVVLFTIPALFLLSLTILVADIVGRFLIRRKGLSENTPGKGVRTEKASILILNWNGKRYLPACLDSVIEAVKCDGRNHEIVVVDNGSTDGSLDFLHDNYPGVKVVPLLKNEGYVGGNNIGVKYVTNDVFITLNNDMVVGRGFLRPLLEGFEREKDVFAVSSQVFFLDRAKSREETNKTKVKIKFGMLEFAHEEVNEGDIEQRYVPVFWGGGGSCAWDKRKFLLLGGFDPLYKPFYVEDADLSYRAWKQGWKVLFCPESIVYHEHRGTSRPNFGDRFIDRITRRNQFLFFWSNIADVKFTLAHLFCLPLNLLKIFVKEGSYQFSSFFAALARLPRVCARRISIRGGRKLNDREILMISTFPFYYRERFYPARTFVGDRPLNILYLCAYLPHSGIHAGAGRMFQLIKRISGKHNVDVLSFLEGEQENEYAQELRERCRKVRTVVREPRSFLRDFSYSHPFYEFHSPTMRRKLLDMLDETDYDILHIEYTQMAQYMLPARRLKRFVTIHEYNSGALLDYAKERGNPGLFFMYLNSLNFEARLPKRADCIITLTEEDTTAMKAWSFGGNFAVVPTGVDTAYFRPGMADEWPNSLLYVGYFRHHPNVDAVVHFCNDVLPIVRKSVPDVKLYIVGAFPPPELRRFSSEAVVVTGRVDDVRPYFERCQVFVAPVRLGRGIRGKVLEAMAMGKPVVSTPLGARGICQNQNADVLIGDDKEDFAGKVVSLLRSPESRRRMGERGRRITVEGFDWDMIANKLLVAYERAFK